MRVRERASDGADLCGRVEKNGSFDAAAQSEAFEKAKSTALKMLGDAAKKTLAEIFGDVDEYLSAQIESEVKNIKQAA